MKNLSFPIGEFEMPENVTVTILAQWISDIENLPTSLKSLTDNLTVEQLNWKYRPNGWTIKQVVHHIGDSHINSWMRYKLALTEDNPTIHPYYENLWAELNDGLEDDISDSVNLITALHNKWARLLKSLKTADFQRKFTHPEHGREFTLLEVTGSYAWHSNHHLAHIRQALESGGKY